MSGEPSKVYFTNFRTSLNENLLMKLKRLIVTAGIKNIDFADKYYGFVWSVAPCTDNFWWDLRNDFIFFYGAADRKNAFQRVIDHEIDYFNKNKESYDIEAAYKRRRML